MQLPANYEKSSGSLRLVYDALISHGCTYAGSGSDWTCPSHNDKSASLGVDPRADKRGTVLTCSAGCTTSDVLDSLGLRMADLFNEPSTRSIRTVYVYENAQGTGIFDVHRLDFPETGGKTFRQFKHNTRTPFHGDLPKLIFGLPDVIKAIGDGKQIWVVGGEKSVMALDNLGICATTNAGGEDHWTEAHARQLVGARRVTVVADRDFKGWRWGLEVLATLAKNSVAPGNVRLVMSATEERGDDIVEHLSAGFGSKDLVVLTAQEARKLADDDEVAEKAKRDEKGRVVVPDVDAGNAESSGASSRVRNSDSGDDGAAANSAGDELDGDNGKWHNDLWPSPAEPHKVAQRIVAEGFSLDSLMTLRFWRGDFYRWDGRRYYEVEPIEVTQVIYRTLEGKKHGGGEGKEPTIWKMKKNTAADINVGLQVEALIRQTIVPGTFLSTGLHSKDLIPFANGNFDLGSRKLSEPTPDLFNLTALPYEYDPSLDTSIVEWSRFLHKLWPQDESAIAALQEWFGYVLSSDTNLQKMLALIGPPRSGKGTIGRILQELIGVENAVGPTLNQLASDFGMQPLIGKSLAVIGDARFSGKNMSEVVERLLSITGEDVQTVNRKNREHWTGQISARFMLISNELPNLAESSGALTGRMVLLTISESWLGREDDELFSRLRRELPGILSWALDGLDRLRERGHFTTVVSSVETMHEMEEMSSPISAFMNEVCEEDANSWVSKEALYEEYQEWANRQGIKFVWAQAIFGKNLRAAYPRLTTIRPRVSTGQITAYAGFRIRDRKVNVGNRNGALDKTELE